MREIRLLTIKINGFRGTTRTVDFTSDDVIIHGRNKVGKSTIFNAFLWVLTGKDQTGATNFELFDNKVPPTYENRQPISVECVFDINGEEVKLRREAIAGWAKNRGSGEYERTGSDNYDFYIDDIKTTATDYKEFVSGHFADLSKIDFMVNIRAFMDLPEKEMRKQLADLAGEIQPSEVGEKFAEIIPDIEKYGVEKTREKYKNPLREIKRDVDALPKTIETLKAALPNISAAELEAAKQQREKAKEDIKNLEATKSADYEREIKPYVDGRNDWLNKIAKKENEYRTEESKYNMESQTTVREIEAKIADIDNKNRVISQQVADRERTLKSLHGELAQREQQIEMAKDVRENLLKEAEQIKARVWSEEKCPVCGQTLPAEQNEERKRLFAEKQSADLNNVIARGKKNNELISTYAADVERIKSRIAEINAEPMPTFLQKEDLLAELKKAKEAIVPFNETELGHKLLQEEIVLKGSIPSVPTFDKEKYETRRAELDAIIEDCARKETVKAEYDRLSAEIERLQLRQRESGNEMARLERMLNLVMEYERARAEIINNRVSKYFSYVTIEMTEINKSGDVVDCCNIFDLQGVKAKVTNNASRILCGVDIASAFGDFYDVHLPMFIDNAEAIDKANFLPYMGQRIRLYRTESEFAVINNQEESVNQ